MCKPDVNVSVVTVSYRDAKGLGITAASMHEQSVGAEWIICDGGSDADSLKLLQGLPATVKWSSEEDDGIYDAMRKGLARSTRKFVLFLNSGDVFATSTSLAEASRVASSQPQVDVFFFATVFYFSPFREVIKNARNPKSYIYHSVPGNQQSTLYCRDALHRFEFPTRYEICGDYALASMLHMKRVRMKSEPIILGKFMMGGRSTYKLATLSREAWHIQKNILNMSIFSRISSLFIRLITTGRSLFIYSLVRK